MALVEIEHNTLRISKYNEDDNVEGLSLNLDLIKKVRIEALLNAITRRKQVSNYFNKGVRHRQFVVGDLVLKVI